MSKRCLVDSDTGEFLRTLEPGSRILPPQSVKKLETTDVINEDKSYVKVYDSTLSMLLVDEGLSGSDMKVLFAIIPKIRYETGLVARDNGAYIALKDIPKLCGLTEKTVYASVNTLVSKRILAKVRVGREVKMYANPYIFMRGVRANKTLISIFSSSRYAR